MKVVRDDAMAVLGFERYTFRCSACHETDRCLVFIKHGRETDESTSWIFGRNKHVVRNPGLGRDQVKNPESAGILRVADGTW